MTGIKNGKKVGEKRNICVVITARPSYSRIKSALQAIDEHPELELQLVVAASALLDRYGSAVKYIEEDGFKIAEKVYMVLEGDTPVNMAKTTGLGLMELSTSLHNLQPDFVISVADRYETIATAIAAAYMNLPLVHIQGGEVTGSIDEKVRHAVTKLADYHFVSTKKARERVIKMGEDPEAVFVTGCPSIDIAADVLTNPEIKFDPIERYGGVGPHVDYSNGYLVVLQHSDTTEHERAQEQVTETLHAVAELGTPTMWFWPNVDAGSDGTSKAIRTFREKQNPTNIHFFKNMRGDDFLKVLYKSSGIVGNSSVAIRECSYLGVPAVNIGSRQFERERGANVLDCGYDRGEITEGIRQYLRNRGIQQDQLYGDGRAGTRIAALLATLQVRSSKHLQY
jgi:UDP-hydrolysing UDP-N-acetyl-D-glucosamine 2-epimerase